MQGSHTAHLPLSAPGSAGGSPLLERRLGIATPGQSPGLKVPSDLQPPASSSQPHSRRPRRAFTLTELLVVIAIIGVLASLVTAAVVRAIGASNRARILLEMKQLSTTMEDFKIEYGAFPPGVMNNGSAPMVQAVQSDVERMAKKAFPRINAQEMEVFRALAGLNYNTTIVTDNKLTGGLRGDEAIYFWLGGFSQDPQYPLSGPGGPSFLAADVEVLENRKPRYEFNLSNLMPRDQEGNLDFANVRYIEYTINVNNLPENRRINFWSYGPNGSEQPLVYFDASRRKPSQYLVPAVVDSDPDGWNIYPYIQLRQGAAEGSTDPDDYVFANRTKFQIVHCGLDGVWGSNYTGTSAPPVALLQTDLNASNPNWLVFPTGPFAGDTADNLTNFTDGEIADETEE